MEKCETVLKNDDATLRKVADIRVVVRQYSKNDGEADLASTGH